MPSELNKVVTACCCAASAWLSNATAIEAVGLLPEIAETTEERAPVVMALVCTGGPLKASIPAHP